MFLPRSRPRWARVSSVLVLLGALLVISEIAPGARATAPAGAAEAEPARARGYWLGAADGGVFSFGEASFLGSMGGTRLNRPVVGMAPTPTGRGYYMVASDGGIFSFGDAKFFGSTGSMKLNRPIVGMGVTPSGLGYWLVASDGGIFTFGDARFFGSTGATKLNQPIVAMAPTASGLGYWLVASDGGIFTFGDAKFFGSTGAMKLNRPIVGMGVTPSGLGYWMVASDGGIFSFGNAGFFGSTGSITLNRPVVGIAPTPTGQGYWMVATDGGIFAFGDAEFLGSTGAIRLDSPVFGMAALPARHGTEVAVFYYPWWGNPTFDGQYVHWSQGGHQPPSDIGSDFYPARATYSTTDPATLNAQFAEIKAAGIDTAVVSWWGRNSYEDQRLPGVKRAADAHGVRVAIHVEPYPNRSTTLVADIAKLRADGYTDFWIYEATLVPSGVLRAMNEQANGARTLAETGTIGSVRDGSFADFVKAANFTGFYTYDAVRHTPSEFRPICGHARERGLLCAPAASPGFSAVRSSGGRVTTNVARANGATYDAKWQGAIAAASDVIGITSYNEWHEATQIEGAVAVCFPNGTCYPGYDGAYGVTGPPAANVYMDRTRFWTDIYRASGAG